MIDEKPLLKKQSTLRDELKEASDAINKLLAAMAEAKDDTEETTRVRKTKASPSSASSEVEVVESQITTTGVVGESAQVVNPEQTKLDNADIEILPEPITKAQTIIITPNDVITDDSTNTTTTLAAPIVDTEVPVPNHPHLIKLLVGILKLLGMSKADATAKALKMGL
jgi:hypothetical protein